MSNQFESHVFCSTDIAFHQSCRLVSQLLIVWSPVDYSCKDDNKSTSRLIIYWTSRITSIDITSKYPFFFYSRRQLPIFHAVDVPEHRLESDHFLNARTVIVPAGDSIDICNIEPSGGDNVHKSSGIWSGYGWLAFVVALPAVKLHRQWLGNNQYCQPSLPTAGDGSAIWVVARTDWTAQICPSHPSLYMTAWWPTVAGDDRITVPGRHPPCPGVIER